MHIVCRPEQVLQLAIPPLLLLLLFLGQCVLCHRFRDVCVLTDVMACIIISKASKQESVGLMGEKEVSGELLLRELTFEKSILH